MSIQQQDKDDNAQPLSSNIVTPAQAAAGVSVAGLDEVDTEASVPEAAAPTTPAPAQDEEENRVILPPHEDSSTVQLDHLVFVPLGEKESFNDFEVSIAVPADTEDRIADFIKGLPNEEVGTTPAEAEWRDTLVQGSVTATAKEQFRASTEREGSQWRQQAQHGDKKLSAAQPRIADTESSTLSGPRAVLRVRAVVGLGTIVQIPLWHSGFWITLKAPGEGALLELYRRIADNKVQLGNRTHGWCFANASVYMAESVLDFAMDYLFESTLKDVTNAAEIRPLILTHDIQTIAWGLAVALWPKGFGYSRSALMPDGVEKPTVRGRLNIAKMQFVDLASLTPWQIGHMAKRAGNTMTQQDLVRYRNEFTRGQPKTVNIGDSGRLQMTLRVPTMDQYINSGHRWVSGVVTMVDQAFRNPPNEQARDAYITNQSKASIMRQMAHWVENIIVDGRTIADDSSIDEVLTTLSENGKLRQSYFQAIHEFIDDSTVSVIATNTVNEHEDNRLPRFPHLLPIDALYTFFTLLMRKSQILINREE
jgi:hypothetical protein